MHACTATTLVASQNSWQPTCPERPSRLSASTASSTANGHWHTIVDRGRVIERALDGRAKRMLGISADVTERSRAEAAREESERRFRAIFETAHHLQLLLDCEGRILEANAAAADRAETTPPSMQQHPFAQLVLVAAC